jgi:hypothetical protein
LATGSFDHLIRAREHRCRYLKADYFGCLDIEDELKFRRLLDGHVSRLSTAQDFVDIFGGTPNGAMSGLGQ